MSSYTIEETARKMNYSAKYVRSLIHAGKLGSELLPISEGSAVRRHHITQEQIDTCLSNVTRKNKRDDGRNKYLLYATPVELKVTIQVLEAAGRTTSAVAKLIKLANPIKLHDQEESNG